MAFTRTRSRTDDLGARLEPVANAARDLASDVSGRANDLGTRVNEVARGHLDTTIAPAAEQARQRAAAATADARVKADPMLKKAASAVSETTGTVVHAGRDASSGVISLVAKLLATLAGVIGTAAVRAGADEVVVDRSPSAGRRRWGRTALLFAGGFTAGAATGYTIASRRHAVDDLWSPEDDDPDTYGDEASLIEQERAKASMN